MQTKTKFDLLYESIMDVLEKSKVQYTPMNDVIKKHLSKFLNISQEQLDKITSHIADVDEYQDYFGVANTDEELEAATKAAENLIIVDLHELPETITADDITKIQADGKLQKDILHDIHKNGQYSINRVLFIDD